MLLSGFFIAVAAQVESRIDSAIHLVGGRVLANAAVSARHDGHFAFIGFRLGAGYAHNVLRDVDNASENVPARRQFARFEQVAREHREDDDRDERQDHGERAKWEQLFFAVPSWVVDEGLQIHERLSSRNAHQEANDVRGDAAISIAVVLEVNDDQQLREQDDVDQIRAQIP